MKIKAFKTRNKISNGGQYSKVSQVRMVIITNISKGAEGPFSQKVITPTGFISDSLLFLTVINSKGHYSERSLLRQVFIRKVVFLKLQNFNLFFQIVVQQHRIDTLCLNVWYAEIPSERPDFRQGRAFGATCTIMYVARMQVIQNARYSQLECVLNQ